MNCANRVQRSQHEMLARLVMQPVVHLEGLCEADMPVFAGKLAQLSLERDEVDLLKIGAAAELVVAKRLIVRPAEGNGFRESNPVGGDHAEFNETVQEAREDEIVKNLAHGGVLILGGAHNLSDNIEGLGLKLGYVVVTPRGYPE